MSKKYPYEETNFYQLLKEEIDGKENLILVFYNRSLNTYVKVFNVTTHTEPKQNMTAVKELTVCNFKQLSLSKTEKKKLNEVYEIATNPDTKEKLSNILKELKLISIYSKNAKESVELTKLLETMKEKAKQLDRELPIFTSKRLSKQNLAKGKYLDTLHVEIKELERRLNALSNVASTFGLTDSLKDEVYPIWRESVPLLNENEYDSNKAYAVVKGDFPIYGMTKQDVYCLDEIIEQEKEAIFHNRADHSTIISPNITKEMQEKIENRFTVWTTYEVLEETKENPDKKNPISTVKTLGKVLKRELVYAKDSEGKPCKVIDITDSNLAKEITVNHPTFIPTRGTTHLYKPFQLKSVMPDIQDEIQRVELLLEDEELFEKINVITEFVRKIKTIDFREKKEFQTYKNIIARLNDMESREYDFSYNENMQDDETLEKKKELNRYYGKIQDNATKAWMELLKYQHSAFGYVTPKKQEIYTMFDDEEQPLGKYDSPNLQDRIGGVVGYISPYFLTRESIEELYDEVTRIQEFLKPTEKKFIK